MKNGVKIFSREPASTPGPLSRTRIAAEPFDWLTSTQNAPALGRTLDEGLDRVLDEIRERFSKQELVRLDLHGLAP